MTYSFDIQERRRSERLLAVSSPLREVPGFALYLRGQSQTVEVSHPAA